ncbi:glycosyltransferase family 4 protein [Cohnella thailandensis]|uniref:Glycosyltransferase family 4 protein n=1 Tax=Cohnella thailandensis TaxID=557557 RepID=A0A841T7A8_9BACL|nr:glycosyltransferase family 4 protein [Cohnella thailandensis]MBB6638158.1 glycosyltransferase family 4 protein [Cohnella thailandensis]MBP1971917.1 glycosyltransferase involved in cell wall biosynthesis [Cohnella thailandensis]
MKRMLMLASVSSMIDQFNMPNIKLLQEMGFQVDVACNFENGNTSSSERVSAFKKELEDQQINYYQIDFARNVTKLAQNLRAYKQVKRLLEANNYSFVHCHSPIGGVVGRLVAKKTNTKVIYTAHGFHFYKGAPLINWLIYYPIEKILSKNTDVLITINAEDYQIAARRFSTKNVIQIPGVGIDVEKFDTNRNNKSEIREQLGIKKDELMLLSVGELSKRKNHEIVIKALSLISDERVIYYICGRGELQEELVTLSEKLDIKNRVIFLGYKTNISDYCKAADLFVFPSLQEGLPVALMEAMASGLPVIASKIRGNIDLIKDKDGGYLVNPSDSGSYANGIKQIINNPEELESFGERNKEYIKEYGLDKVEMIMRDIYKSL